MFVLRCYFLLTISLLVFRFLSSTLYISGISVLEQDVFNSLKERGEQLSHGQYFIFFRKQHALEINIILYCVERKPVLVAFHVSKRIDFCFFLTCCVNVSI